MEAFCLKVGQVLDVRPEGEGPAPVLTGGGFEVFCFYGGLTRAETEGFATGAMRCGVYVEDAIPVLVLEIEDFGGLEVAFNIFAESEEKRRAFFEEDPQAATARLILCDHPAAVVRAVRTFHPGIKTMSRIKQACFDQLSRHDDVSRCFAAMARIYDTISPEDIRSRVVLRPA